MEVDIDEQPVFGNVEEYQATECQRANNQRLVGGVGIVVATKTKKHIGSILRKALAAQDVIEPFGDIVVAWRGYGHHKRRKAKHLRGSVFFHQGVPHRIGYKQHRHLHLPENRVAVWVVHTLDGVLEHHLVCLLHNGKGRRFVVGIDDALLLNDRYSVIQFSLICEFEYLPVCLLYLVFVHLMPCKFIFCNINNLQTEHAETDKLSLKKVILKKNTKTFD